MDLMLGLLMMAAGSILIMYACNSLEQVLDYLGRNMVAGAKGALLMAVASSLPEIMVSFAFLFSGQPELVLAGIFVTAGSAVFNVLLIPALSIIFAEDGKGNKVKSFQLNRKVLSRDTFWLLAVESLFIYFLGMNVFTLTMAITLVLVYGLYVAHVMYDSKTSGETPEGFEFEELDHTETPKAISWVGYILDFNKHLFGNKSYTTMSAVVVGLLSCTVIGVACHYLAESTQIISTSLGIPVVIGAAVFAAAATSLPDSLLSISAAKSGEGDDAVANAVGSNIFDTSMAVGLPLVIALTPIGTYLFGFDLSQGIVMEHGDAFMNTVRYFVLGSSALAAFGLIAQAKNVTKKTAYFLLSLYAAWIGYLVYFIS